MGGQPLIVFRRLGLESKIYVVLFVAILFSGTLFRAFAPYLILVQIVLLVWMSASMVGKRPNAYINRMYLAQFALLVLFGLFLWWQVPNSIVPSVGATYVRRFLIFSVMLILVPSTEVVFCSLKASKVYAVIVALSILALTALTGEKTGGLVGTYQFGGMMMSVGCMLFLVDYFVDGGRRADALGFFVSLLALLVSGKRMFALIVVIAFVLLYLMFRKTAGRTRALRLSAVGAAMMVPAYYAFPPVQLLASRMRLLLSADAFVATSGRNALWEAASVAFQSNVVTGIGFGGFPLWIGANYDTRTVGEYLTHNIYYGLLAETGLVGFTIVVSLLLLSLIQSVRLLARLRRQGSGLLAYIITFSVAFQLWFIVYGFTGNGIYGWHEMFLYMSALAMMLSVRLTMRASASQGESDYQLGRVRS